jgi:hypothetical protein
MGSLVLIAMMSVANIPTWLFLTPLYPALTAIAGWDPFYALINLARLWKLEKPEFSRNKLALGS